MQIHLFYIISADTSAHFMVLEIIGKKKEGTIQFSSTKLFGNILKNVVKDNSNPDNLCLMI